MKTAARILCELGSEVVYFLMHPVSALSTGFYCKDVILGHR